MVKRLGAWLVGVLVSAGLLGCVSADTYRLKEQEVQSLYSANEDMQGRNNALRAEKAGLETRLDELKKENGGLEYRLEKQDRQIVFLKNWTETLEKDGDSLRARAEKLNAKIAELDKENQRLAVLSRPENLLRSLGDRLTDLQKQVEALTGENEKLKTRQVAFMAEDKQSSRTGDDKISDPEGGKPQAVTVSSGQNMEDSEAQDPNTKLNHVSTDEHR